MEIMEAIKGRRSIRKFKDKPVPDHLLMQMIEAAHWAPSACNRQLWEFVIATKQEIKDRIADEACFGQSFLKRAPTLIVVFYDDSKERREQKGKHPHDSIQSAAAAIQNIHLAAYSLGLGSLWVCAIKHLELLNKILRVPERIRPIAIVAVGYPAETPRIPVRRPMQSFIHHETFKGLTDSYNESIDPRDWSLKELRNFRERICWYGGTITPENTLENHAMDSRTYRRILTVVADCVKDFQDPAVLDILPFAGGYLIGLLKNSFQAKLAFAYEFAEGNRECIEQNLDQFDVTLPDFIINQGEAIRIETDKTFDLITCLFRLERMPDPVALLDAINDKVKSGGYLVVASELRGLRPISLSKSEGHLHTSGNWSMGPSWPVTNKKYHRWVKNARFKILSQEIIREGGLLKSLARNFIRNRGPTLILTLKKD